MQSGRRTIRLFVSSTFSDMKAERDILQREIFPRIRKYCMANGLRFQAIDLRWGVSEEAGRHNRTMRICLRELQRCQQGTPKPNFLILLGDRYGWRPLPETIPADLFEELEGLIQTESPANADLLSRSYRRDNNAVPPEYVLLLRQGICDDGDHWSKEVEAPLLTALQKAARSLASDPRLAQFHVGVSATHQEIIHGALTVEDAPHHVHGFLRTISGQVEQEQHKDFVDWLPDGRRDEDAGKRLDQLKTRLEECIGRKSIPLILGWYHLEEKYKIQLSLALNGRIIRNKVLDEIMPLLWYGLVDKAIDLLGTVANSAIKNRK